MEIGQGHPRNFMAEQGFEPESSRPKSNSRTTVPSWLISYNQCRLIDDADLARIELQFAGTVYVFVCVCNCLGGHRKMLLMASK